MAQPLFSRRGCQLKWASGTACNVRPIVTEGCMGPHLVVVTYPVWPYGLSRVSMCSYWASSCIALEVLDRVVGVLPLLFCLGQPAFINLVRLFAHRQPLSRLQPPIIEQLWLFFFYPIALLLCILAAAHEAVHDLSIYYSTGWISPGCPVLREE